MGGMRHRILLFLLLPCFLLLGACQSNTIIINDVDEREANEIIVFLAHRNIPATKIASSSAGVGGMSAVALLFNISVDMKKATEAMALLNQNGLPRKRGVTLLDLFAAKGLMSSDKEETIRYQAGLAEQLAGMIRKIDGIVDAEVQLAFPPQATGMGIANPQQQKVTASVYVKHQGVLDDPNSHLVTKIKRLVSASVNNLDINDVTVIPDRARFGEASSNGGSGSDSFGVEQQEGYVSIWSIVMNKESASKFRFLFFVLLFAVILFVIMTAWLMWKFYPILRKKGGLRELLNLRPIQAERLEDEEIDSRPKR
jgi:type III secretion protein J